MGAVHRHVYCSILYCICLYRILDKVAVGGPGGVEGECPQAAAQWAAAQPGMLTRCLRACLFISGE